MAELSVQQSEMTAHSADSHGHDQNENRKFGMWLYLASEVVIFAMLIAAYVIFRVTQPTAVNIVKDGLGILLVTGSTFVLLASSYAMVMGLRAIELGDKPGFYRWIGATALLGMVFLGGQYVEYSELGHLGITLDKTELSTTTTIFEDVIEVEAVQADGSTILLHGDEAASVEAVAYNVDFANDSEIFEGVNLANFAIAYNDDYILLDGEGAVISDEDAIEEEIIALNDGSLTATNVPLSRLALETESGQIVTFESVVAGGDVTLAPPQFDNLNAYFGQLLAESTSQFGMRFYAPTAFHGAHVFIGVIWALLIMWRGYRGFYDNNAIGVEMFGLYWHFVDVVWIVLFTLIYLI